MPATPRAQHVLARLAVLAVFVIGLSLALVAPSSADSSGGAGDGSAAASRPAPSAPRKAVLHRNGTVTAPANAPIAIKRVIAAANKIAKTPYRYGGGHGSFKDSGYDCSGSVSYALHGGRLLGSPLASGDLARYGSARRGRWITIYANGGHAYMVIAGLRFDTSGARQSGSRWQRAKRSNRGFTVRHPNHY